MAKRQKLQPWPITLLRLFDADEGMKLESRAEQHASCSCHMRFGRGKYHRCKEKLSVSKKYLWEQQQESSIAAIVEPRCTNRLDCNNYPLIPLREINERIGSACFPVPRNGGSIVSNMLPAWSPLMMSWNISRAKPHAIPASIHLTIPPCPKRVHHLGTG